MAQKRAKARVGEKSTTSGSGPWTLVGALDASYQDFSYLSDGDIIEVTVREPGAGAWTGQATYNVSGGVRTISPTTVEETINAFGAGTKEISADLLASRAMVREDMAGAIVTTGTSTAYAVASFRNYDTLTRLHGQAVAFSPHVINGQTVTLNVDGLGAKPLRKAPGVELQSNVLIAGTPYTALYNHTDDAFYLHSFGDAPGLPLGTGCDYWGATAPSTAFALAQGQAISRITFAPLFALFGTTFGSGDGSTTFNIPDKVGRVSAMLDAGSARLSSSFFGGNPANRGAIGGAESHTLTLAELAAHSHANTLTDPGHTHTGSGLGVPAFSGQLVTPGTGAAGQGVNGITTLSTTATGITINNAGSGSGNAHNIVQPTIICNYIIRVI